MSTSTDVQLVHLSGTPRDRGHIHGEALRPLIAQGMERWKEHIHRSTGIRPDDYLDRFVGGTDFLPSIERWTPDLLAEVQGIGEAANIPFRDVYAYQLMDEEWFFRFQQKRANGRGLAHCSTIAVFGEGQPPILAQNMDLPKWYDGTQTLLRVESDGGVESFLFTPAGLIGTTGLNNQDIGVCVNSISQLGGTQRGLPVAFVVRHILAQTSFEAATGFIQEVSHASAQNYAIGGPEGVVDYECSPNKVVQFMPTGTRIHHTNHPLVNDDQPFRDQSVLSLVFGKGSQTDTAANAAMSDSEQRFAFLSQSLEDSSQPIDVERVKALLSTREVPISVARDSEGQGMTLGSLIMQLSIPPVLHLAPGPPADTEYRAWTF
jgi:isopenicillin-N N-acyltransferase like protein